MILFEQLDHFAIIDKLLMKRKHNPKSKFDSYCLGGVHSNFTNFYEF
jgi:hypothetical protein